MAKRNPGRRRRFAAKDRNADDKRRKGRESFIAYTRTFDRPPETDDAGRFRDYAETLGEPVELHVDQVLEPLHHTLDDLEALRQASDREVSP